jgi:hypothetical protein
MDHLIHFWTVDEVVVHGMPCERPQVKVKREAIVDVSEGSGIPHQRVALGRQQQRDSNISIVLAEFHGRSAVVE